MQLKKKLQSPMSIIKLFLDMHYLQCISIKMNCIKYEKLKLAKLEDLP